MENGPPTFTVFALSAFLAVGAFIQVRYAEQIKRWKDTHALFHWQLQTNRTIAVSTYRLGGWICAFGSLLMLVIGIAQWFGL
jgi:hypothetical protein